MINRDRGCGSYITDEEKEFIRTRINEDISSLLLRYAGKELPFRKDFVMTQIKARQKGAAKLHTLLECDDFIFPTTLLAEQSTDETIAAWHASLAGDCDCVADLTAGLGVDLLAITDRCRMAVGIEMLPEAADALRHNIRALGRDNITIVCADSMKWLHDSGMTFDLAFIDPARRSSDGRRTYALSDCTPDVAANLPLIMSHCRRLLIKASPMLDVTETLRQIPGTAAVYAVSLRGECKELLLDVRDNPDDCKGRTYHAVLADTSGNIRDIKLSEEDFRMKHAPVVDPAAIETGWYLYEPDAALMKLDVCGWLCSHHPDMYQASPSTKILLSPMLHENFPGRILQIRSIDKLKSRQWSRLKNQRYNVCVRNFPLGARELAKRLKVRDGGDSFIYGLRLGDLRENMLVEAVRI